MILVRIVAEDEKRRFADALFADTAKGIKYGRDLLKKYGDDCAVYAYAIDTDVQFSSGLCGSYLFEDFDRLEKALKEMA